MQTCLICPVMPAISPLRRSRAASPQEAMTAEAVEHGALRAQLSGATVPINAGLSRERDERDDARAARLAVEALAYDAGEEVANALAPEARAALAQTL